MLTIPEFAIARQQFKFVDCPHCGKRLNAMFRIVAATRNCPFCGRRVLAEPDSDEGTLPYTREQLDAACAANRATRWWAGVVLFTAFLLIYGCMFANLRLQASIEQFIPAGCLGIPLMVLVPGLTAYRAFVMFRRAGREALKCPVCSAPCSICSDRRLNVTQLTGNCTGCGRKLVERPAEELAAASPTVAEHRTAALRLEKSGVIGIVALALVLSAPIIYAMAAVDDSAQEQFWRALMDRHGLKGGINVGVGIILAVVVTIFGAFSLGHYLLHRRQRRRIQSDPALHCPHCRAELFPRLTVIASQRCPACRKRVLAEPVASP